MPSIVLCTACSVGGIVGGNFQHGCQPASVGEFWYDDFMRDLFQNECKDDCKHVKVRSFACNALSALPNPLSIRSASQYAITSPHLSMACFEMLQRDIIPVAHADIRQARVRASIHKCSGPSTLLRARTWMRHD